MTRALIGLGGHAKVVYELAEQNEFFFDVFVDPLISEYKKLIKMEEYDPFHFYFLGIGGTTPDQLMKRHLLYEKYKEKGCHSFVLKSEQSYISPSAIVGDGTLIAHRVVIQTGAKIGENVIINTGVIIEHDAIIEDGCHIAPGAIVLGGARVGQHSMIGAGAVILPNQVVPSQTLVPSLSRYN